MKISKMFRTRDERRCPVGLSYRMSAMKTDPWWRGVNGIRIDLPRRRVLHVEFFAAFRRGPFYWDHTRAAGARLPHRAVVAYGTSLVFSGLTWIMKSSGAPAELWVVTVMFAGYFIGVGVTASKAAQS